MRLPPVSKISVPRIAFLETRQIITLPVSESNQKENPELCAFIAASRTGRTRTTSRTPDFQAGLYLTKTYHIEPFTSISRNRPSALRQTLQSRSNPPCNVWTGAYGHAPSTIKNGEGRQADLSRFTLPGFPAY